MLPFLVHWYRMAEVYAVILVWVVVPLGFYACYLFFQSHYRLFTPPSVKGESTDHGAD